MKRTLEEARFIAILVIAVMVFRAVLHLIFLNAFGPAYISLYTGAMLSVGAEMLVYSLIAMLIVIVLRAYPCQTKKDRAIRHLLAYCGLGGIGIVLIAHLLMLHYTGYSFEWTFSTFQPIHWFIFCCYIVGYVLETAMLLGVGLLMHRSPLKVALLVSSLIPIFTWYVLRLVLPLFLTDMPVATIEELADMIDDILSDACTIWILFTLPYALRK